MKKKDSPRKTFIGLGNNFLYYKVFLPAEGMAMGMEFLLDWRNWPKRFLDEPLRSFLRLVLSLLLIIGFMLIIWEIAFLISSLLESIGILPNKVMRFITNPFNW